MVPRKDSIPAVLEEVTRSVEATPDQELSEFWQTPSETLERGAGDCEDFAWLAAAMLYEAGYEPYVLLGWLTIGEETYHHAWVEVEGTEYETITGNEVDAILGASYDARQRIRYRGWMTR
jgi:transglutaminase-like putative cysteine protease